MSFGNNVRQRRIELGMTQDELAKMIGYSSRSSINKIELGRNVSQKVMLKVAEALNTTPGYLMGFKEQSEADKSIDAVEILKDAFNKTRYYDGEFTDEQIMDIMKYAKFIRSEDRHE